MTFKVRRSNASLAETMDYVTINGTAKAGQDYVAKSGRLEFALGQAELTVDILINEDTTKENDEEFFLVLKFPNFNAMPDGTTAEGRRTPFGRGIIRNDDLPTGYVDSWAGWAVDPNGSVHDTTSYGNGTWMRGWDGDTPTYLTPTGTPWVHSMIDDGAMLKTNDEYGKFRMTIDWRIADVGESATPMYADGTYRMPENAEHFGNSGVYIYNRYEVQINSTNVGFRQSVPGAAPSANTQLTPGWAYKVAAPDQQNVPYNYSAAPGSWNRMVIEFTPATVVNFSITQSAKLRVYFAFYDQNGVETTRWVTFGWLDGWNLVDAQGNALKATGTKATSPRVLAADIGNIFLQSHWGSLVEYKSPLIVSLN